MRLIALSDDSLLSILDQLTIPQLLALRLVCQRLCRLIENRSLRTIKYVNIEMIKARRLFDVETNESSRARVFLGTSFGANSGKRFEIETSAGNDVALYLSRFLANVQHFTFSYSRSVCRYNDWCWPDEQHNSKKSMLSFNSRIGAYLQSPWADSLISLQLLIIKEDNEHNDSLFVAINRLSQLKHVHFHFPGAMISMPDNMPILSGLHSFILSRYWEYSYNHTFTLLSQLGPDLRCLRLHNLNYLDTENLCEWMDSNGALLRQLTDFSIRINPILPRQDMQPVFRRVGEQMHSLVALHTQYEAFDDKVSVQYTVY